MSTTPQPEPDVKARNRESANLQIRRTLDDLEAAYGLDLGGADAVEVTNEAKRLHLPQRLLNNESVVIPCAVELADSGLADPALVVPSNWPVELLPAHKKLAVGGQVKRVTRSPYTLPRYIMDAAWRTTQVWQGSLMPLLVKIPGEGSYLVRANSWFFRLGDRRGQDIDPSYTGEPGERDLKRGSYPIGDDMHSELTVVIARF